MRVHKIMTKDVKTCHADTDLAGAAVIMWEADCGVIPVVDHERKLLGMITDRDICVAVATKGRLANQISAHEVLCGKLHTCSPDDDVRLALVTMQTQQIRRLPVVDSKGILMGILSLNDIVLATKATKSVKANGPTHGDIIKTLKSICKHRTPGVTA